MEAKAPGNESGSAIFNKDTTQSSMSPGFHGAHTANETGIQNQHEGSPSEHLRSDSVVLGSPVNAPVTNTKVLPPRPGMSKGSSNRVTGRGGVMESANDDAVSG